MESAPQLFDAARFLFVEITSMNRAEQAEFYVWALDHNLIELREVIEWADAVILEDASPDLSFITLALSGNKKKYEVVESLFQMPGEVDKDIVFRKKMSVLYELVSSDKQKAAWVTHLLYRMAIDDEISDEDSISDIYQFEDAFEYILDDKTEVTNDLIAFLQRYSS